MSSGNIAPAPQLAASQALAPAPLMSGSLASMQALSFYRIPLFLLPIYQAAAAQYGVPWQVLAAINEVETDYGTDLSISTAGAVGWMQFMPETWLQYGVDAVNAGYADPYNPVDAVFAAARYLHAAGAASDLHGAIFAYNHSEAYVQSVLLRARLISSYPPSVVGTLTGLTEGSLPAQGATLVSTPQQTAPSAPAPATSSLPGSTPAPAPALSAARAEKLADAAAPLSQLSELAAPANAPVLAVEDGRIVGLGRSRKLGNYIVLRDTYGDVFTYAGLGSIVPAYRLPKPAPLSVPKGALRGLGLGGGADPTPTKSATSGSQSPLTLHVATKRSPKSAAVGPNGTGVGPNGTGVGPNGTGAGPNGAGAGPNGAGANPNGAGAGPIAPLPAGSGKVRVFAHPGNPDALAAARAQAARSKATAAGWLALTRGSLVAQGTVLGRLEVSREDPEHGYMRFAVRPPGAQSAIDPAPILQNWSQLDAALHPQGARGGDVLAGATASDAFLLSPSELEHAVLADPGIRMSACDRHQVALGRADEHMLALLVFLSRSGLKPTVGELRCGRISYTSAGPVTTFLPSGSFTISAINGVAVSGHQGAGTITDVAIRTLLTVKPPFAPKRIVSLMQYPGVTRTVASRDHAAVIEIALRKPAGALTGGQLLPAAHAASAHAPASVPPGVTLGSAQWRQLIARIGALPRPKVSRKPSAAAVRDLRH